MTGKKLFFEATVEEAVDIIVWSPGGNLLGRIDKPDDIWVYEDNESNYPYSAAELRQIADKLDILNK